MKNLSVDSMFSPHCRFRKVYLLLLFSAGKGLLVVKTFYLSALLCEITSKVIFFICGTFLYTTSSLPQGIRFGKHST